MFDGLGSGKESQGCRSGGGSDQTVRFCGSSKGPRMVKGLIEEGSDPGLGCG